jgi:NADP-dependent 3-hydroxy acid dehydrogenase YdfG
MSNRKVIFITGAGAGIGAETAKVFVRNGWLVGASDISQQALDKLQQELGQDNVATYMANVVDFDSTSQAISAFAELNSGQLDAVFANAGVLFMGPNEEISAEQKKLQVDVNINGVINTIDAAFPFLKATPDAHLIAMSSTSAEYGAPQHAVYSATKFFVRGLTEALNVEYKAYDINVSALYVSYVQTGMVFNAEVKAGSIERMGVKVTPQQVAETVWKAVQSKGNRVHWRVGLDAHLLNLAVRLLGGWIAPIYQRMMK